VRPAPARILAWTAVLPLGACAGTGEHELSRERALLERAIRAAGGEDALARSPVLAWTGSAVVHAGDHEIALVGEWTVQPPDMAISRTWPRDEGRSSPREISISSVSGTMTLGGRTSPMPQAMLAHERQQFGLYGIMRLLPLRDERVTLGPLAKDARGRRGLRAAKAGEPAVDLYFGPDGRLAALITTVRDPATGAAVREQIELEGSIEGAGIRWPRNLRINRDGAPYFDLSIETFRPRASW